MSALTDSHARVAPQGAPMTRLRALATAARLNHRVCVSGMTADLADRLLAAALAHNDPTAVVDLVGPTTIRDGYRDRALHVGDARLMLRFVREARAVLATLDRESAALTERRDTLRHLLDPRPGHE